MSRFGHTSLALALLLASSPVLAASITPLPAAPPAAISLPGAEQPVLRSFVQLVWNPVSMKLERVSYTAWDPLPSRGLDLEWRPDDASAFAAGPLNGRGTLSFRLPGAPGYDRAAIVAQYRGALVNGQPEGFGEYVDNTGLLYAGSWHNGLMAGQGRLLLPTGDEYRGAFVAGLRHGEGVLVDAAGRITRGLFTHGVPDAATALAAENTALKVGIVTERRPRNFDIGLDPLNYTTSADTDVLNILPDDPRLLAVWHGTDDITLNDAEQTAFDSLAGTPNFLGVRERYGPVSLVFDLENTTTEPLSVLGGVIEVSSSVSSPEPAVQARTTPRDPCAMGNTATPQFFLDNFGWAAAQNAVLSFSALSPEGTPVGSPMEISLGTLADSAKVDVSEALTGQGVQMDMLTSAGLFCSDIDEPRLCLAEVKKLGYFGPLADALTLDFSSITTRLGGTLSYDWQAADGSLQHKQSPFSVIVPIGTISNDNECGEGGEIIPVKHDPFMLHLDDQNYKIAIPFSADIDPGFLSRWRIELQAPQTSTHEFRIRLMLADGDEVLSRPVRLTYFLPPDHPVVN